MYTIESIEQLRQKYPTGKFSERINNNGRRKVSYKGLDGIVHPIATRVHRDATSRINLSKKYHQRKKQNLTTS